MKGEIMTDTEKLKFALLKSKLTQREIAKKLGLSFNTVYRKVNGHSEFNASEIQTIGKLLNLNDQEKSAIFFAD
jgi:transcriptional regulator with XRE-family HTH domain